jgi:hypothetical protein
MPNAQTRLRRRKTGKPTYFHSAVTWFRDENDIVQEEKLIFTRTFADTKCVSRFLILSNCPSNALMTWLQSYLTESDDPSLGFCCAWRLEEKDENYSVWIFKTVQHAQMALDRFHSPIKKDHHFAPENWSLDKILVLYQVHGNPSALMRYN